MSMVFCFGELLLRMSPQLGGQWIENSSMPVYVGGAELNAATALANWGIETGYCTALPDSYLAEEIITYILSKKIDPSPIIRSGNRIGSYYLPQGADLKNAGVIYDRADSSFACLKTGTINWDKMLSGYTWFHFSAISPALTGDTANLCLEAVEAASRLGLTISIDLNYRAKLWQYGSMPVDIMPALVKHCQVIMGNLWAVESLLGLPSPIAESKGRSAGELVDAARESMQLVREKYPSVTAVAYTFRLSEEYFAVLDSAGEIAVSEHFTIRDVIDRVGSGDCFMGGLIYGLYAKHGVKEIIDFAAAAAVGKLHEKGDASRQSVSDVKNILTTLSIKQHG
ncbi:MAG: sugar kinase [Chitinophagaceae bacterium]|nr:MAG: sugar kinase [Chitinophagaceae bacterium]